MDSEDSREDTRGGGSSSGDSSPETKEVRGQTTLRSPPSTPRSPSSAPQSPDSDTAFEETRRQPATPPSPARPQSPPVEAEGASPLSESFGKNYYPKSPEPPASPDPPLSRSRSPASPPRSPPLHDENETSGQKWSPKSESRSRQDSLSPAASRGSRKSDRNSRERAASESSGSSRESTPDRRPAAKDPPTEEVSDGEMESDHEIEKSGNKSMSEGVPSPKSEKRASESNVNMSHEDLSDVSDLDSMGPPSEEEHRSVKKSPIRAPDQSDSRESPPKPETKVNGNVNAKNAPISPPNATNGVSSLDIPKMEKIPQEKTSKTEDVEEQLDFEAEEGECVEAPSPAKNNVNADSANKDDDEGSGAASSLEEGEVSDEEERRPEETEPRPVCRFYSRGQCTWGISCRFLHPGVTDKGNYTMFDMVRAMPAGYAHASAGHHLPSHHHQHIPVMHPPARLPPAESPWERGLRTAKEMLRKASKRKEQDSDFEEKKMHLSLAGSAGGGGGGVRSGSPLLEDEEGDVALYAAFPPSTSQPASPPPSHSLPLTHIKREREREREDYYRQLDRRAAYEEAASRASYAPRERPSRYRTTSGPMPASPPPTSARHHRQPPPAHYMEQDVHERGQPPPIQSAHHKSRRGRTTREVIVQRAARGDEWADPWMRGGGDRAGGGQMVSRDDRPGKKGRNYSSATSYSSSSSRSSSSKRSGSPGRNVVRRGLHSPMKQRLAALSPSVIVQERRAATARAQAMNPPAPSSRKRAPSPAAARQHAANPPPPQHAKVDAFGRPTKTGKPKQRQRKHYSKSSTSGSDSSSSSSDSESDSRSSSSSSSSSLRRAGAAGGVAGRGAPMHHPHLQTNPNDRKHRQDVKAAGGQPMIRSGQPMVQKKDVIDADMRKELSISKKRAPTSPINSMVPPKKPASRREELLKQLKAVEDAIARKRSKI